MAESRMTGVALNQILTWHGCYDDSWSGLIVPEATERRSA